MNHRHISRMLIPIVLGAVSLTAYSQQSGDRPGRPSAAEREEMRAKMDAMSDDEREAFREQMHARREQERAERDQAEGRTQGFNGATLDTKAAAGTATAEVAVNWENITLKECIETLCRDLRMEFIISPSVNVAQEVSVRAGDITEWKREHKLSLFDAILETAGVQRVQRGRVWVFSPSKLRPVLGEGDGEDLNGGTAIIGVLRVKNITAAYAANILNQIDGKPVRVFPQNGSSTLLVSGTKDFLEQTESLLTLIDVPPAVLTNFMIKYADASDLANELNALFTNRAGGDGSSIQFIPITRLNMIVAHNAPESMHEEIQHWVTLLDSAEGANERVTKVYHIQVIDAESIATTLNSLYSDLHDQAVEKKEKYGTQNTATANQKTTTANKKTTTAKTATKTNNTKSSTSFDYAEEEVIILADQDTNTLIVNAPMEAHREVEKTLRELDQARTQVLIETVLVEVTLDEGTEMGVEWAAQQLDIGSLTGTAASLNGLDPSLGGLNPTGLITNAADGLTYLLSSSDNMMAMVHAAEEDDRLQVLSSPTVLTRDGMEASISFGEEVPIEEKTISDSGTETFSYDYRDAKISLTVTPHIDDNRMVTLALEQEVKQVDDSGSNAAAPTFRTRELSSSLQVYDNQTLVLGGLIQRTDVEYTSGVPILCRIPLIKYLFSYTAKSKVGTEILMIITPRVIENVAQADSLTQEYRRKVLGSMDVDDVRKLFNITDDEPEAE